MPPTARAALCELIAEWSARWHAVTEAAGLVEDPAERRTTGPPNVCGHR